MNGRTSLTLTSAWCPENNIDKMVKSRFNRLKTGNLGEVQNPAVSPFLTSPFEKTRNCHSRNDATTLSKTSVLFGYFCTSPVVEFHVLRRLERVEEKAISAKLLCFSDFNERYKEDLSYT